MSELNKDFQLNDITLTLNCAWSSDGDKWSFYVLMLSPTLQERGISYSAYGVKCNDHATPHKIDSLLTTLNWSINAANKLPDAPAVLKHAMADFINEAREKLAPTISAYEAHYGY